MRRPIRTELTLVGISIGNAVKILQTTPAIKGLLEPDLSPKLFLVSIAIAIAVGIVSAGYIGLAQFAAQPEPSLVRLKLRIEVYETLDSHFRALDS